MVILSERIHDARIVPLDGRPRLPPQIRNYGLHGILSGARADERAAGAAKPK